MTGRLDRPTAALDLELRALIEALGTAEYGDVDLAAESVRRARAAADLNCFIELFDDDGSAAGGQSKRLGARAKLQGVPYAVKDVFRWPGHEPTGGSLFRGLVEGVRPSRVVEQLTTLGARLIGTTNLDEICYGMTGLNPHFGPVRNPWDPSRITGGSSSGAAAAVAARVVPFALGSDTGGSTRVPAALCGVTGFKPTLGTLSTAGVVLLSETQDSLGFLARSAADCALIMGMLTDRSPEFAADDADPPAMLLRGLRVGVVRHPYFDGASAGVTDAFGAALDVFRTAGACLADAADLDLAAYDADAAVITGYEAVRYHHARMEQSLSMFSDASRIRLEAARAISPRDFAEAFDRHRSLTARPPGAFTRFDVLVAPTVLDDAPPIDELSADAYATVAHTISALRCTRPFSYLGCPAISVPMGFSPRGLPLGLQILGAVGADVRVLAVAHSYQRLTNWHAASPPQASYWDTSDSEQSL